MQGLLSQVERNTGSVNRHGKDNVSEVMLHKSVSYKNSMFLQRQELCKHSSAGRRAATLDKLDEHE